MWIYADEGMAFRRIKDGLFMGREINLGMDYTVDPPAPDADENYEQIDNPETDVWPFSVVE